MSNLSKNILSTIVYYDILDYPMTAFELWKYLGVLKNDNQENNEASLTEVINFLESDDSKKFLGEYRGFYFLLGREYLVEKRIKNNKLSEQKIKIIRRVVFWLRFVPYVRMIAVTGTVAMKNASAKSDLDLLIVISRGRLFFGRILVTALVHLMGKRRYAEKITDRICLNCFLADQSLESRLKDAFSSSEYFFARVLFGQKIFYKFQTENKWIRNFKTNFFFDVSTNLKALPDGGLSFIAKKALENVFDLSFFDVFEKWMEKWQTERIANDPRTKEEGSIIMADAEALIFFHRAHSLSMEKLFQKRLSEIGIG